MIELTNLHTHGVFLRREALEHGYDDKAIQEHLRARLISRVRHGAYAAREVWDGADELGKYRLRCHAVITTHDDNVALSHTSAVIMHGFEVWEADLTRVHLTRLDGSTTRRCHDIDYHRGHLPEQHLTALDGGGLLTIPARAAVEHASVTGIESGLVTLDSYLNLAQDAGLDSIREVYAHRRRWPGNRRLHITLGLARTGSESIGETRLRFLCWEYHLPEPQLQFAVNDSNGALVGTSDFAWSDRRVLGEFDGRAKYETFLRPGERPSDVVVREKRREDRMRECSGYSMIRFGWPDLFTRDRTAHRLRKQLGLA